MTLPPLPDLVFRVGHPTEELRYAIRSQVANVQHRSVWTAGEPVPWLTAPHINVPKTPGQGKYDHAYQVLRAILTHPDLTPHVIISDDDMYALQPIPHPYPAYTRGRLGDFPATTRRTGWTDTLNILGPDHPCHDLHIPTRVNRAQLAHRLNELEHELGPHRTARIFWRTLAAPTGKPIQTRDPKIHNRRDPQPHGPWASTRDTTWPTHHGRAIRTRFPNPTPWET